MDTSVWVHGTEGDPSCGTVAVVVMSATIAHPKTRHPQGVSHSSCGSDAYSSLTQHLFSQEEEEEEIGGGVGGVGGRNEKDGDRSKLLPQQYTVAFRWVPPETPGTSASKLLPVVSCRCFTTCRRGE